MKMERKEKVGKKRSWSWKKISEKGTSRMRGEEGRREG